MNAAHKMAGRFFPRVSSSIFDVDHGTNTGPQISKQGLTGHVTLALASPLNQVIRRSRMPPRESVGQAIGMLETQSLFLRVVGILNETPNKRFIELMCSNWSLSGKSTETIGSLPPAMHVPVEAELPYLNAVDVHSPMNAPLPGLTLRLGHNGLRLIGSLNLFLHQLSADDRRRSQLSPSHLYS